MIFFFHFRYGVGMIYYKQEKFDFAEVHYTNCIVWLDSIGDQTEDLPYSNKPLMQLKVNV
jgi:hypothetical protein